MIYLDNNASTALDEEVIACMVEVMREDYANASSTQHKLGRRANHLIESARESIANSLAVESKDILFTSGATEAINILLKGFFARYQHFGKHIITCTTEHKAILNTFQSLEQLGAEVTYLPVDKNGQLDLGQLKNSIRKDTLLVSIMSANNETGILSPVDEIAEICKDKKIPFFSDMTQSIGKQKVSLDKIDFACFSAHKFHGPKGIGVLYIKNNGRAKVLDPLISGGTQEKGLRPGTYDTPAIVGMAKALAIATNTNRDTIRQLRNFFEKEIVKRIPEVVILGQASDRIDNTSNILFKHVRSEVLFTKVPMLALSSGAACVSGDSAPSHVLKAMQLNDEDARCCVRFSLSKYTSKAEIVQVLNILDDAICDIRNESPTWQLFKAGLL